MKLSEYAKKLGIYMTAWRIYRKGEINAYLPTGTIIVEPEEHKLPKGSASMPECQAAKISPIWTARQKGLGIMLLPGAIYKVVKEVGSGVSNRTKLAELLKDKGYRLLLVEHKDRLTRFGFNYKLLLAEMG